MSIDAIGYVRSDISGTSQRIDEERLRAHAKSYGYNLRKTIVFGSRTDNPEFRLGSVLDRLSGVRALIVPTEQHFDGDVVPTAIAARVEVVVVSRPTGLARLISATAR